MMFWKTVALCIFSTEINSLLVISELLFRIIIIIIFIFTTVLIVQTFKKQKNE